MRAHVTALTQASALQYFFFLNRNKIQISSIYSKSDISWSICSDKGAILCVGVESETAMSMSTIQHTSSIPPQGVETIVCDSDEEAEPKTILEIGGISRPIPTYATPHRNRIESMLVPNESSLTPSGGIWLGGERTDIVPSPHRAFSDFQEHRIIRMNNGNWNSAPLPYKPMVITKLDQTHEPSMYATFKMNSFVLTWTIFSVCERGNIQ